MNSLMRYQQPAYDLVSDEESRGGMVRGSARATPEQALVVTAANLPQIIHAMASADRDCVSVQLDTREDGFWSSGYGPNARITIRTSK